MKKLFIIAVLIITANLSAQSRFNVVDYEKPHVSISIQGKIEIDGHTFDNEKSKDPVIFEADLNGIKIYNSKTEYKKRKCDNEKCKVIHLQNKSYLTNISQSLNNTYFYQNTLELNR